MTIQEALTNSVSQTQLPLSELVSLLSFVTGHPKEFLFAGSHNVMTDEMVDHFEQLIARRVQGVPLAYLKSTKEFFGRSFYVDKNVLVPRPETEHLIEHALIYARTILSKGTQQPLLIADIGTGSGAIAVTMALELPTAKILAVDISAEALKIAEKNAKNLHADTRIDFLEGDLLAPILLAGRTPTIIMANLPYIAEDDVQHVEPDVHAHEPHLALYSGKKGTEHYARLFLQVEQLSSRPRVILGEIGINQTELIYELAAPFIAKAATCTFYPDLAGIPRVFLISFPSNYV